LKKIFRIILKTLLYIIGLLLIAGIVIKIIFTEEIPQGTNPKEADAMALRMLDAINYHEFYKSEEITWTFRNKNTYRWNVRENMVEVSWDDYRVELFTIEPNSSTAYKNDTRLSGTAKSDAMDYAIKNFNNDSFWVAAPFKVFDRGTTRKIVEEDGEKKLLVTYESGGSTPGDVYLWTLDEEYRPVSFKMWVSNIPLDGIEAQWSDWEMTAGGFPLSRKRSIYNIPIPVTDLSVE
jgi:hypothetical protein